MAISPAKFNISMQRRADYYVTLHFKDGNGADINLNGWTVIAQAWDLQRTTKYGDFAIEYADRGAGTVKNSLTDEQTTTFPGEVFYDVPLVNPSGIREYYLEGTAFVSEGYTA